MIKNLVLIVVLLALATAKLPAQYYDWGQNPASVKWQKVKTPGGSYVFPDSYSLQAARLINYMDTVRPYAGHGFTYGPMKLPMVMHTQNFQSNGLVLMAPKRMEFIVTPSTEMAALPWLKQLSVHEFRHSVQYNNLNRGFVKALSYILGQQGAMIGAGLLPYWFLEGDAVLAETQMSGYGRGLQPSFTMQYRAFCLEDMKFSEDQYFSGSYKYPMPSQYNLGYQIVSWADTKYGHNIWDKVARYASRNPYVFFTNYFGLRKYYQTTPGKLFDETFDDLWKFWRSQPVVENSSEIIAKGPFKSYTTYTSPLEAGGRIFTMKEDMGESNRIVSVDMSTGSERLLARTGLISSPMTYADGRLYWTEYRQSTFWEQRVNSQVCYYDLATGSKGTIRGERISTYPVAMEGGGFASLEYDYRGRYSVKYGDSELAIPDTISVHGLAFDDATRKFYFIALSDGGMWIGSAPESLAGFEMTTRPNYSSIANLRAGGGKLYYNSIATGKDEAHVFDLASGKEYALTESKYGSFSPAPTADGVVLSTFTKDGYLLAKQGDDSAVREVEWSELPRNTVNPPRRKWDSVINITGITVADTIPYKSKRYRKGLNLIQVHSWMPFYLDVDELIKEADFTMGVGATFLSQNLLNSTFMQLGYRYTNEGHLMHAKLNYYGLAPKFEIEAEWGTMDQIDLRGAWLTVFDAGYKLKNYFDIQARVYLPILLSSGHHIRRLTPEINIEHNNARLAYPSSKVQDIIEGPGGEPVAVSYLKYQNGYQKVTFSLRYSDNVRLAYRDFLPKWGYGLRVAASTNPFSSDFRQLYTVYGNVYLPGVMAHHSVLLRGTTQKSTGDGLYGFTSKDVFPRGAEYNRIRPMQYSAFSADYQLPVWYPDLGIPSVLYITRVRLKLGLDMAFWDENMWINGKRRVWSYGGEIGLDIAPLSMPFTSQGSVSIGVWKPSDRNGVVIQGGITLPL